MGISSERTGIPIELRDRVLQRMGLREAPATDLRGLRSVYRAWCENVPFDNIRKMIALRTGQDGPLPGIDARDFLENWIAHGTGATCWPSSNALGEFILSMGFRARRVGASMGDNGRLNHGSVKVSLDGDDWLVDSSMLTSAPLPLRGSVFIQDDPIFRVEVEAVDGAHLIWWESPPNSTCLPCRLLKDPSDYAEYAAEYEATRQRSVFNQRLYVRRNLPSELFVLYGHTRFSKTPSGLLSQDLSAAELRETLVQVVGLSEEIVEEWIRAGGLEASFEPPTGPGPEETIIRRPPSERGLASREQG